MNLTSLLSFLCFVMGALPVVIALGVIPADPADIHAPLWVIGMAGGLFWLAALALLARNRPKVNKFNPQSFK